MALDFISNPFNMLLSFSKQPSFAIEETKAQRVRNLPRVFTLRPCFPQAAPSGESRADLEVRGLL